MSLNQLALTRLDAKIPPDLLLADKLVFSAVGLKLSKVEVEPESVEYGACKLELGNWAIRFRVAKITPKKIGQFVTIWKRSGKGPIQPYDESDPVDALVVSCRSGQRLGQFVLPKAVLCRMNVFSRNGEGGKRAIRVYPPWDKPTNSQAVRIQVRQLDYFMEVGENQPLDYARARMLYGSQD